MSLLDDVEDVLMKRAHEGVGSQARSVVYIVMEAAAKTCEHGICEGCNHAECVTVRQRAEAIRALKSPR